MKVSLILFTSLISLGQSFIFSKHAFEDSACSTLRPKSGTEQLSSAPYIIELSSNIYQPEQTIRVTIKGNRPSDKFKGFFVEARRDGSVEPYGTWQTSSLVKLRDCKSKSDAITHSDLTDRDSISLTWNPPSTFVGTLRIHATVMKDKNVYYLDLKSAEIKWFRDSAPVTRSPFSQGQDFSQEGQQIAGLGQQTSEGQSLVRTFDDDSCTSLKPSFKVLPQTSAPPLIITTDNQFYQSPNNVKVTLNLKPEAQPFRGFILQAHTYQSTDTKPIGSFKIIQGAASNAQLKTCESQDDTVIHKTWAIMRKIEVYFVPPAYFNKKIVFHVTVLQDFSIYWYSIASNPLTYGGQTSAQTQDNYGQQTSAKHESFEHIADEGTCSAPCKRKYPIGTGRGVADILLSVKQTLQTVEQMLQSKCAGPSDCGDVQALGFTKSEVYSITPKGTQESKDVFCDLESNDGGWLVISRKLNLARDAHLFDKTWEEYKTGFGDLRGTFRLGNELVSRITRSAPYEAHMEFELPNGDVRFAHYSSIKVEDENNHYKFQIGAYDGTAGDQFRQFNSQPFSTKDRDNSGKKCPQTFKVGSWFNSENCFSFAVVPEAEGSGLILETKIRPANFKPSVQHQSTGTPMDCAEVQNRGFTKSMVYKIQITKTSEPIDVYCDLTTDGGGWTIMAKRKKRTPKSLDFDRDWNSYKVGFGSADGEYRLGNEKLSQLTIQKSHQIRFDTKDIQGKLIQYAQFSHFSVASEVLKYRITIQSFSGTDTILQALLQTNNMPFSTKDRDNDGSTENCAQKFRSGFWYIQDNCLPSRMLEHKQYENLNEKNQQSSSQQPQSSSQIQQSGSFSQQTSNLHQQSYQQNVQTFDDVSKLEKLKTHRRIELKTRPLNFKQKLQESKYGGSKKTTSSELPKNCAEVQYKGNENSGVYNIQLLGTTVEVYCDLVTDGGGWVVFKRHSDDREPDGRKTWNEYKRGFGDKSKNFFLGLDKISALTRQEPSELLILIEYTGDEGTKQAVYSQFSVGDETTKYRLTIGGHSGNLTRMILGESNGQPFSTKDKDNDGLPENCAMEKGFGGWFGPKSCSHKAVSRIDKLVEQHSESSAFSSIWKDAVRVEVKIRSASYKSKQCCKA